MSIRRILLAMFLLWAGVDLTAATSPKRIIAYVYRDADIHRISAAKLTHINYAFAHVTPEGDVIFDEPEAAARIAQLQALKAVNPRLKILASIGGWGADHFSDAAVSEVSRERFASSALKELQRYALDGLDLDWEYPGQPGPGIKYREEDKENFTALLATLRRHLDALSDARKRKGEDRYLLTIASSAGEYFRHTEMDKLHVYLDFINIMTYDMAGSWTPETGHHAGLFWNTRAGESGPNAASFVKQHLDAGIPPEKLVLGVPLYGRGWTGVRPENLGFAQPYEKDVEYPWSAITKLEGFEEHWDEVAKAPFLWNPTTRTFVSYENPRSLREKARFIRDHRLGGFMYWEHSQDPEEELLAVMVEALR